MNARQSLAAAAVAVGATILASACGAKKPTALMVAFSSELDVPKNVDRIEIEAVDSGGTSRFYQAYDFPGDATLPGTISFYAPDGTDSKAPITISVYAYLGKQRRFLRRATLGFVAEETKLLRLPVRLSCVDFPICDPGQTCIGGACKSALVDVHTLPAFAPELVFGQASSAVGCFDVDTCLASPTDVTAMASSAMDCSFALPGRFVAAHTNLALTWGVAGAETTVPIDADPVEGWTEAGGVAKLADGLCTALHGGRVLRVEASLSCVTKSPTAPLCPRESREIDASVDAPSDASTDGDALGDGSPDAPGDASGDGGTVCSVTLPGASCDPVKQTGCGDGQACRVTGSASTAYVLTCDPSVGPSKVSGACTVDQDCGAGLACYQSICVGYCCGDNDCGGQACSILQSDASGNQFRLCHP